MTTPSPAGRGPCIMSETVHSSGPGSIPARSMVSMSISGCSKDVEKLSMESHRPRGPSCWRQGGVARLPPWHLGLGT